MSKLKKSNRRKWLRPALIALSVIVVAAGVVAVLELTNTTHLFHESASKAVTTGSAETKGEVGDTGKSNQTPTTNTSTSTGDAQSSTTQPGDEKSDSGSDTPVSLLAPTGNFVSAHIAPATASLASVCNTTPGVNCQIVFTSGSITKSLPAQSTDRGGSTYWNSWTPKSIGLTVGKWDIKAVASKGAQTQSASDALSLEITE